MSKVCSKCGEEKPRESFSKRSRALDGLYSWCKECAKAYYKAHGEQYRADHKDQISEYTKAHKVVKALYDKRYQAEHQEQKKAIPGGAPWANKAILG